MVEVDRLYNQAREDYEKFKSAGPFWLVEEELRQWSSKDGGADA